MRARFILLLSGVAITPLLHAQAPPAPAAVANASVSGIVRDKNTGAPAKDYTVFTFVNATFGFNSVSMTAATKQVSSKTDASGRYRLSDLPPAPYRIEAQGPEGPRGGTVTRNVTVAGQDLDHIDFKVIVPGTVSGRIVDENKDPQPNMSVSLVSKEYYLGSTGYYFNGGSTVTNDLGEFTITNVTAGHTYYLMTDTFRRQVPPHAETPLSTKMRRRVARRTWYPSSPDKEGAAPIVLRPGEHREGVDIEVKKSPSYCISGVTMSAGGVSAMSIGLEMLSPSSGTSASGGSFRSPSGTMTGADGKFRICDLAPGTYRVTVNDRISPDATFALNTITISDQDLTDLRYPTSPRTSLEAQVVLDGIPPPAPLTIKARVGLRPMFRTQMPGEKAGVQVEIPGAAQLTGLIYDDFTVDAFNTPGLYLKDVTYGARSVRYEPLHLGSSQDGTIRFVFGQDGGTISAKVADKDGNPVSGTAVIVIPQGTPSEAVLAARIVSGQTDQAGMFKSPILPPGKYYVIATEDSYDMTTESIGRLWQSHTRYQEVSLEANASAQVTLQPQGIR